MYVSTRHRFIVAMGGEPRTVADFPQGDVAVDQFEDIEKQVPADASA